MRGTIGKIIGIRVQDIQRQLWFNWDEGKWDTEPSCTPGINNLYVAVWAENVGEGGDLLLTLVDDEEKVLASKTEHVEPAADHLVGIGIEWTGTMPDGNYGLTCTVDPGALKGPLGIWPFPIINKIIRPDVTVPFQVTKK